MESLNCSIDGCDRPRFCRGWCKRHYDRWRRHGDPTKSLLNMSERGAPLRWLYQHAAYQGDDCLTWPFARFPDGRAHISEKSGTGFAARRMCEIAHGDAPTDFHEAAHSCGKARDACVNPAHLRWATPVENAADKVAHGTVVVGSKHYASKLTEADILAIRSIAGTMFQREIAAQFGVKLTCINKIINGKSWRHVT